MYLRTQFGSSAFYEIVASDARASVNVKLTPVDGSCWFRRASVFVFSIGGREYMVEMYFEADGLRLVLCMSLKFIENFIENN